MLLQRRLVIASAVLAFSTVAPWGGGVRSRGASDDVTPSTLLVALRDSRASLPSARIKMAIARRATQEHSKNPETRMTEVEVIYSSGKWAFDQSEDVLDIRVLDANDARKKQMRLDALRYNRAKAIEEGIGKLTHTHTRSVSNDDAVYCYAPAFGAHRIGSRDTGSHALYLFDPRILGVDEFLAGNRTLEETFVYLVDESYGARLTLVGMELVHGVATWHVRGQMADVQRDYWIGRSSDLPIHRYESRSSVDAWTVESYYGPDVPAIPTRVEIVHRDKTGIVTDTADIVVQEFHKETVPDSAFGLGFLGMPVGQSVEDVRSGLKHLGYWDGKSLVGTLPRPPKDGRLGRSGSPLPLVVVNAIILLLLIVWRFRPKRASGAQ